jgi:hypothetical protein
MWRRLIESRCGKALESAQRRWLELFEATARRDTAAMAGIGAEILEGTRGARNPASEFAFFAATTALICRGDHASAGALLQAPGLPWIRPGVRVTELALLDSLSRAPSAANACPERAAKEPPAATRPP